MYRRKRKSVIFTYGTDHSKLKYATGSEYIEANIYTDPHNQNGDGGGGEVDDDNQSMQSVTLIFRDGSQGGGSRAETPEKEEITSL